MTKRNKHQEPHDHPSAIYGSVEVSFALERAEAHEIYLCGEFNQWAPSAVRMIRTDGNGRWEKRLMLAPGRYEYKFVADGEWTHDPNGQEHVVNVFGSINSVVEVR
jgi:1,4-alpha-glucan branching enzyme